MKASEQFLLGDPPPSAVYPVAGYAYASTPCSPDPSLGQTGQAGVMTYGAGEVFPGNPNRDLLFPLLYTTNRMRVEVQQGQYQLNMTAFALFKCVSTIAAQISVMMTEIEELRKTKTFVVPLTTLAREPLQMKSSIPATVEGDGEEFTATFYEANVSASGETQADAIANLKESLVSRYEFLESLPENELGPLPARQWEVLRNVLAR